MKKLFTITCLLFAVTFTAQQARAQVDFGIRGGVNFASLNDVNFNAGTNVGVMAGVYLQYPIANSPIVIQPEILYAQKGYEIETANGTERVSLNYIEVPVLIKFNYVLDGPLTPYVAAGPYVGFLVGSKPGDGEGIKNIDFGVAVGAGASYRKFNLGIRYSAGLTSIFDAPDVSAKNGVISIVAGYSF